MDYRQIFRNSEEVSQLDNISRRYAWLKRLLKTLDEKHADIFPPQWFVTARVCEQFCNYTRYNDFFFIFYIQIRNME